LPSYKTRLAALASVPNQGGFMKRSAYFAIAILRVIRRSA
jgi:hypothetical protein